MDIRRTPECEAVWGRYAAITSLRKTFPNLDQALSTLDTLLFGLNEDIAINDGKADIAALRQLAEQLDRQLCEIATQNNGI